MTGNINLPTLGVDGNEQSQPDAQANADWLKAEFEKASPGRELRDSDPESILLDLLAYAYSLGQEGQSFAIRQTLLPYAQGEFLDLLGQPFGAERLKPTSARITLEFSLVPGNDPTFVPVGVRVRSANGEDVFSTIESGTAEDGIPVQLVAEALQEGESANGYEVGEINQLIDPLAGVLVSNTTESSGGSDGESDENFRARIPKKLLEAAPSTNEGYEAIAKSTDQNIQAVSALGPKERVDWGQPQRLGEVDIYILDKNGLPSPELLSKVEDELYKPKNRIIADFVHVKPPTQVSASLEVNIVVGKEFDSLTVRAQVEDEMQKLIEEWQNQLGGEILESEAICQAKAVEGVRDVTASLTSSEPLPLAPWKWAGDVTLQVDLQSSL
jgi:phage-related baseplate assembly protein